ncbi:hypothetical protein [Novosphingobium lindaniclasticum]|uniref:hypothetical protein n=1 Tax=Novosphingobium lindaniclasticum TaxID=1329895 RepID=UPI00240A737C|nr:hypothetical protein [Novosphingobium lindaniclasticum]
MPNRASFPNREGPEGYEFPACATCQTDTRLDEIAFSCMVYFNSHDETLFDERGFTRLIQGLKNNLPHMNEFRDLSPNQKRRALTHFGIERPHGTPLAELGLVTVHPEFNERTKRYLCKLARALFYKHVGRPAKSSSIAWSAWAQGKGTNSQKTLEQWLSVTPIHVQGTRSNFDFGNRFRYRINYSDELEVFLAAGQFGDGLIFYLSVASEEIVASLDKDAFQFGAERSMSTSAN